MKILSIIYDIVYNMFVGFFELLSAAIVICIVISIPIILSYAVVNNGHHIFDPVVALVFGAGLVAIISIE